MALDYSTREGRGFAGSHSNDLVIFTVTQSPSLEIQLLQRVNIDTLGPQPLPSMSTSITHRHPDAPESDSDTPSRLVSEISIRTADSRVLALLSEGVDRFDESAATSGGSADLSTEAFSSERVGPRGGEHRVIASAHTVRLLGVRSSRVLAVLRTASRPRALHWELRTGRLLCALDREGIRVYRLFSLTQRE